MNSEPNRRMIMADFERIRLVLLGGAGVGKSCVVRRFLLKTYCDKYRPTVEDLHNREYDLGSVTLKVMQSDMSNYFACSMTNFACSCRSTYWTLRAICNFLP